MLIDDVLEALPDLSDADLGRVFQAAKLLGGEESSQEPSEKLVALYEGFREYFVRKSVVVPDAVQRALSKKQVSQVKVGAEEAYDWIEANFKPNTETERIAIIRVCCEIMVSWAKGRGSEPTPRSLCFMLKDLPVAVDSKFPGYAANGLLGMVMDQMTR